MSMDFPVNHSTFDARSAAGRTSKGTVIGSLGYLVIARFLTIFHYSTLIL